MSQKAVDPVRIVLLLIIAVLTGYIVYSIVHYLLHQLSDKISPQLVETTSYAGTGLTLSLIATKLLPFLIAFRIVLKIIRFVFTVLLLGGLALLYLHLKHPDLYKQIVQTFS